MSQVAPRASERTCECVWERVRVCKHTTRDACSGRWLREARRESSLLWKHLKHTDSPQTTITTIISNRRHPPPLIPSLRMPMVLSSLVCSLSSNYLRSGAGLGNGDAACSDGSCPPGAYTPLGETGINQGITHASGALQIWENKVEEDVAMETEKEDSDREGCWWFPWGFDVYLKDDLGLLSRREADFKQKEDHGKSLQLEQQGGRGKKGESDRRWNRRAGCDHTGPRGPLPPLWGPSSLVLRPPPLPGSSFWLENMSSSSSLGSMIFEDLSVWKIPVTFLHYNIWFRQPPPTHHLLLSSVWLHKIPPPHLACWETCSYDSKDLASQQDIRAKLRQPPALWTTQVNSRTRAITHMC